MAVTFRAAAVSADGSSATSIAKPTGTVQNDVILLIANCYDDTSAATYTWPSGFAQIGSVIFENRKRTLSAGTHSQSLGVAWKVAGGSEGSTYTVTNGNSQYQNLTAVTYTGNDTTTPIDVSAGAGAADGGGAQDGSGYTATWPTLGANVSRSNSIALAILAGYDKDGATPASYTARENAVPDGVNDVSEIAASAGTFTSPTAAVAANGGGASNAVAMMLVIIQPPGASTPSDVLGSAADRINRNTLLRL